MLGLAEDLGAPYVDVELKAVPAFSASRGVSVCLLCGAASKESPSTWLSFHGPIMALCSCKNRLQGNCVSINVGTFTQPPCSVGWFGLMHGVEDCHACTLNAT